MLPRPAWRLITLVLPFTCLVSMAQNLVPNPGFEAYSACPGGFSEAAHEFRVNDWRPASFGTPDHFHACSVGEAGVPHNWAGVSDAYGGKGYVGIYLWMDNDNPYREYLQCQLLEPLIRDSTYHIEFHYKLSSYSKYSIDRIGLALSEHLVNARHDDVLDMKPALSVIRDSALTTTTGLWEMASLKYKASGGERFVIIGNFFNNETTHYYRIISRPAAQEMLAGSAYYYVDNVSVIPEFILQEEKRKQLLPEFSLPDTKLNTTYVLKNILFALNSYKLVPPSFDELDKVADYMLRQPHVRVQLFGHTDDQGSDRYNQKLSRDRAQNVADYLKTLGIRADRIEVFGYGKSKPLTEGTTDEARAMNRRVEVRFIQ